MKKTVLYLFAWLVVLGCNDEPEAGPPTNLSLIVYPSPASRQATVFVRNTTASPYTVLVFNPEGKKILERSVPPGESQIPLPLGNEPKGHYQAVLKTEEAVITYKFVKV